MHKMLEKLAGLEFRSAAVRAGNQVRRSADPAFLFHATQW